MDPIIVHGMFPLWGIPSPSPFCLKLETWLRMAGLPYEARIISGPPKDTKGKVPYVSLPGGGTLGDTTLIIEHLTAERGVRLDEGLTERERATALAMQRLVENHLYFATAWERWAVDEAWRFTRDSYFGGLPPPLRLIAPPMLRRKVLRDLWGHGLGRHTPDDVVRMGSRDLDALAALLGDQEYLLGRPSSVDASAYGLLANLLGFPPGSRLADAARRHDNLVAYVARMRARYWGDWTPPGDAA